MSIIRCCLTLAFLAVVFHPLNDAQARPRYFAELTKLLEQQTDARAKTVARELRCRVCHTTEPPKREHNAFGKELAGVLGDQRNVEDSRCIQMALHRSVFLLRNRDPETQPNGNSPPRKRYVKTVLKENAQLAAYEMPLSDVLDVLATNNEIEIETDAAAIKQANLSTDVPVSLVIADVPLKSLLKFLLADHGLDFEIRGNKVVVIPAASQPDNTPRIPRAFVRKRTDEIDPELAGKLKKQIGAMLTITEKDGDRFFGRLLKLHTKEGKLDALSVYSAKSSSRKRYVELLGVKEIRTRTQTLFSRESENDPVVKESRRLEKEVLLREQARKRERLQTAYRRQQGRERAAESLRTPRGKFELGRAYESRLGSAAEVVEALGSLAVNQADEARLPERPQAPRENNPESVATEPRSTSPPQAPTEATPSPPAQSPAENPTGLPRKTVVMKYQSVNGRPPALRYGTRIRYDTADPNDPHMQQGDLDDRGECRLEVPIDVRTIRVYTTPFGGSEGSRRLAAEGETTVTIQIEGD